VVIADAVAKELNHVREAKLAQNLRFLVEELHIRLVLEALAINNLDSDFAAAPFGSANLCKEPLCKRSMSNLSSTESY
jgi:hypothetical protein